MKREFNNIIIFNPFGIGDVIFSTPLIRLLHCNYPDSKIYFICNKRAKFVVKDSPFVEDVMVFEKDDFRNIARFSKMRSLLKMFSFLGKIKALKADMMIDLSLNYRASLYAAFIGIKTRVGFNYRKRGKFLTHKLKLDGFESKHVVYHYADLLKMIDISYANIFTEAFTAKKGEAWADNFILENNLAGKKLIGIVPGGGRSWGENAVYRRWKPGHFGAIADRLSEKFRVIPIIFGDIKESDICIEAEKSMRNKVINMSGKTDMEQFMALVKKCSFVVCNEGGPLHTAVALGVPTVSIFGPVDDNVYGPMSRDKNRNVVVTDDIECRPCYKKFKHKKCDHVKCLHNITEDTVFLAAEKLIQQINFT